MAAINFCPGISYFFAAGSPDMTASSGGKTAETTRTMFNNHKLHIGLLALAAIWMTADLSAQGDLPTGQVDVVRTFEARLAEAERIDVAPQLPPLDTTTRRQTYSINTKTLEVAYLPPQIRPLAFRTEKPEEGYNGYLRLGAGLPLSFYGDFSYDATKNEQFDLGVALSRHTTNNTSRVENQRASRNNFGVNGTYYSKEGFAVSGNMGFRTRTHYYYGYNELNKELETDLYSFQPEDVRQRFNMFDIGAKIFNGQRTQGDINYSAGVNLYLLEDSYAARENGLDLKLSATKWFNEKHPLRVNIRTDFTAYRDTARQNLNNFYLNPTYTYHSSRFQAKIGFNLTSNEDNFSFFPDLEATAVVIEGVVNAYVGATGTLQKNNFRNLSDYNPFIHTRLRLRNAREAEYYGGIKGNVAGATYNAQVSYKNVDNLALFQLRDPLDSIVTFGVLYDTASIFTIKGSISMPLSDGIDVHGSVAQHFFSLETEEKPWHLPSLSLSAGARYATPDKKGAIRLDLFLENGVPYRNIDGETKNLNGLFDLSIGGEYFFSKNFGGFITLNNLANNRRQRWYRYPTFGLNVIAGVSARF